MKVKELFLQNFRCFEELTLQLDSRLTVIVADNGMGKTTILDSIAVAFGRLLTKLPRISGLAIKHSDIRIEANESLSPFAFYLISIADFSGQTLTWSNGRRKDSSKSTVNKIQVYLKHFEKAMLGYKDIDRFADDLIEKFNSNEGFKMPLIVYYGTSRAIVEEVKRRRNFKKEFSRFESLVSALSPNARFKDAFEWFNAMEDLERREQKKVKNFDYSLPELDAVRSAIESMLPGFYNPRTEVGPLRFVIDHHLVDGSVRTLRLGQLSDGYKVMLGLVMDLARRMAQANPPMVYETGDGRSITDPLEMEAIVLIDEVDLHLHPTWQQRVLPDLLRTFPNTQFIVTTHSPQVISTISSKCLRIVHHEKDIESGEIKYWIEAPLEQTKGVASSHILAVAMHTDPVPPVEEAMWLSNYRALIQQGLQDTRDGQVLKDKLLEHFGDKHPEILECERMIRLSHFKRKLPANEGNNSGQRG